MKLSLPFLIQIILIAASIGFGESFWPSFKNFFTFNNRHTYGGDCGDFLTGEQALFIREEQFIPKTNQEIANVTDLDEFDLTNTVNRKKRNHRQRLSSRAADSREAESPIASTSENGKVEKVPRFQNNFHVSSATSFSSFGSSDTSNSETTHRNNDICSSLKKFENSSGIYLRYNVSRCTAGYIREDGRCQVGDFPETKVALDNLNSKIVVPMEELEKLKNYTIFIRGDQTKTESTFRDRFIFNERKFPKIQDFTGPEDTRAFVIIPNEHLIPGSLFDGFSYETTEGDFVHISTSPNVLVNCVPLDNDRKITTMNGVIYVTDQDIPIAKHSNLRVLLESRKDLARFTNYLKKFDLLNQLSTLPSLSVVAISDKSFEAFSKSFINSLKKGDDNAKGWLQSLISSGLHCSKTRYPIDSKAFAKNGILNIVKANISIPAEYQNALDVLNEDKVVSSQLKKTIKKTFDERDVTSIALPEKIDTKDFELNDHLFLEDNNDTCFIRSLSGKSFLISHHAIQCSRIVDYSKTYNGFYATLKQPLKQMRPIKDTDDLIVLLTNELPMSETNPALGNISNFVEALGVPLINKTLNQLLERKANEKGDHVPLLTIYVPANTALKRSLHSSTDEREARIFVDHHFIEGYHCDKEYPEMNIPLGSNVLLRLVNNVRKPSPNFSFFEFPFKPISIFDF